MAYFICPRWEPAIFVIQTTTNSQKKVVYSQPRTGFILGAFTIAVPSKNILEDSQPSWVRSLHCLPSSICVLHFHALHEFCTLSGRHIICIFPRFNWMQQVTTICYSTPSPLLLLCRACSFTQLGGGQTIWCVKKRVSITAPRRKVKYMRLFSWTIVLFAIQACINLR